MGGPRNVEGPNKCLVDRPVTNNLYLQRDEASSLPSLKILQRFLSRFGAKLSGYSRACCDVPTRAVY